MGNPARGFATTSIASKPKVDKSAPDATAKEELATPSKEAAASSEPSAQALKTTEPPKKEAAQTPEELEAQLERDELQLLVEKHASKVRRESHRQVAKFQTDRRVLRGQSHAITVHDWLSGDIMDRITTLAQAESNDSNRQGQQSLLKSLSEEDAMSKLWTLDITLRELGFSKDHIQPVLRWLCATAAGVDTSASIWGLQEALEWLALNQCDGHSFSYEELKPKASTDDTSELPHPCKWLEPYIARAASRCSTERLFHLAQCDFVSLCHSLRCSFLLFLADPPQWRPYRKSQTVVP